MNMKKSALILTYSRMNTMKFIHCLLQKAKKKTNGGEENNQPNETHQRFIETERNKSNVKISLLMGKKMIWN